MATLPFVIIAGRGETDAVAESWPLISSVLLLSTSPVSFTFVTEASGAGFLQARFDELKHRGSRVPVLVRILEFKIKRTLEFARELNLTVTHHSGAWGMTKLFLPWLFPEWRDIIVIDTDMVLVSDPAPLPAELQRMGERVVYSMPLTTKQPLMTRPGDICSCIVLLRCGAAREASVHPRLWAKALKWWQTSGKLEWHINSMEPPHGDQGMYYSLWATRIDLFMSLDESWNIDRCHSYYNRLAQPTAPNATPTQYSRLPAHILHRNCMGSSLPSRATVYDDAASPFFNFFAAYPWNCIPSRSPV